MSEQPTPAPPLVGTETSIDTNSATYNHATRTAQQYHEEVNTAYNHRVILDAFKSGRAMDISDAPKVPIVKGEPQPCIILGSGPSLDETIKHLKGWKGGIVCTGSHALTLIKHGIEPTHVFALDPFDRWDDYKGIDWSRTKTKLICHPGVWPDLVANWPNEMYLYIENNGKPDSFYAGTQKRMYSHREGESQRNPVFHYYIKTEITLFACSPPAQMFAASVLGYGTMFLAGVDFGFDAKLSRFTNYTKKRDPQPISAIKRIFGYKEGDIGIWEEHKHETPPNYDGPPMDGNMHPDTIVLSNNGLLTQSVHVYYKKNFLSAWNLCGKTIYRMGHGIMTEVPEVKVEDVMARQGYGYTTQPQAYIEEQSENYLATVGAFVLNTSAGKLFIEAKDPENDLVAYMKGMRSRYVCDICGIHLTHPELDVDHSGDLCPRCQRGHTKHEIEVDIESNMARIRARLSSKKP